MKKSDKSVKSPHTPEHNHAIVYGIENSKVYKPGELGVLVPQIERIKDNGEGQSYYHLNGGPFIVLTIEELREVWDDGEYQGEQWAKYMHGDSFEDFLTSKGIQL